MQLNLNPGVWEEGEEAAAEGGDGEKVQEEPAGGRGRVEASGSTSGAANPEGELQQGKAKAPTLPKRRKAKGVVIKIPLHVHPEVVLYLPKGLALEVLHQLLLHFLDLLHAAAEEKNVVHVDQKQHQLLPLPLEKEALITAASPESHLL
ncbi:unnamed protein product [Closterium sp. NIES-54]